VFNVAQILELPLPAICLGSTAVATSVACCSYRRCRSDHFQKRRRRKAKKTTKDHQKKEHTILQKGTNTRHSARGKWTFTFIWGLPVSTIGSSAISCCCAISCHGGTAVYDTSLRTPAVTGVSEENCAGSYKEGFRSKKKQNRGKKKEKACRNVQTTYFKREGEKELSFG
jgi:hypothetical protein